MIDWHFEEAEWDSQFFGLSIGKLIENSIPTILQPEFDLYWAKIQAINTNLIDRLTASGFRYVEGEIKLAKKLISGKVENQANMELATPCDIISLKSLTSGLYQFSRYRSPWFSEEDKNRFYATWIEKAVLGTFDDVCLLQREADRRISGFISLRVKQDKAVIGLMGVAPDYQGKGIGQKLMQMAESFVSSKNAYEIEIATQAANTSALNLYIKSGFRPKNTYIWLYKTNEKN